MTEILATLFAAGYALLFLLSYRFRNHRYTIWVLIGLSFLVNLYLASVTDVLNIWDEQFHALVGKNLADDPLHPKLYREALLDYDFRDWARNHIWLHKPPLFLWFIALSIKIFGATALAVRIPSILLASLTMIVVAKLAIKLKDNEAAWWVTVLLALNPFLPLLVTGIWPTDHNDVAFIFFVTLSYSLFIRYIERPNLINLVWLSLAVSACILNKWILGLWVYIPFGVYWLQRGFQWKIVGRLIGSVILALIPPGVWYLYIHGMYPAESAYEFAYNSRHFFVPLEGHRESWYYFFKMIPVHYGIVGGLIVLAGLASMYRRAIGTLVAVAFVYLFFTVAATKMPAFTFWIAPVLLLFGAVFLSGSFKRFRNPNIKATVVAGLLGLLAIQMQPAELYRLQTEKDVAKGKRSRHVKAFRSWAETFDEQNVVVSDLPEGSYILFMFYTDAIGYDFPLSAGAKEKLRDAGKTVLSWENIELETAQIGSSR